MAWAGAANIQEGVTIDMSAMASVEVSEDRKVVKVGAGARWGDVYRKLEVMGLGVSGGRVADVGVAGLIIGGVFTFPSPPSLS
jgi:FAD/FMN-containing dehydrogenase